MCEFNLFEDLSTAVKVQKELARAVVLRDDFARPLHVIGGMDVSCNRFDPFQLIYATTVALSFRELKVIETHSLKERSSFPYRSGFLSFREAPALIQTFEKLKIRPDLLLVDGQGIAHPRGLGIASHIGVLLDIPTIGVAKSILVGKPEKELGLAEGSRTALMWKGQEIGKVVRSKKGCLPLVISPGHRISLETAVEIVLQCKLNYRLPEPTRQAHLAANRARLA